MTMKREVPVAHIPDPRHDAEERFRSRGGHNRPSGPDGNDWRLQDLLTSKASGR
jgi:hypothetical protein